MKRQVKNGSCKVRVFRYNDFYRLEMPYISTLLGWSYIFYPTTEIYNMPYPKLVTLLRQCLKSLYKTASELERRWLKEALLPQRLPRFEYQAKNPSRANRDSRERPTKPTVEPSRQVEKSDPSSSQGPAYHIVEKPQKSSPNRVHPAESRTAVKPEVLEERLLTGLAVIRERLGERVCLSSKWYPSTSMFNVCLWIPF